MPPAQEGVSPTPVFTYTQEERRKLRDLERQQRIDDIQDRTVYSRGDLGYASPKMLLAGLPYRETNEQRYVSRNGSVTVSYTSLGDYPLPYGSYPRLILIWMTMAVMQNDVNFPDKEDPNRYRLKFGSNLRGFMAQLGIDARYGTSKTKDGKTIPSNTARFEEQLYRLCNTAVNIQEDIETDHFVGKRSTNSVVSKATQVLWTKSAAPEDPNQGVLLESWVDLNRDFFDALLSSAFPIDMGMLRHLKNSPMALDLYLWLTYRVASVRWPTRVPLEEIMAQFGTARNYDDPKERRSFNAKLKKAMAKIHEVWPETATSLRNGDQAISVLPRCKGIQLYPLPTPSVPPKGYTVPRKRKR